MSQSNRALNKINTADPFAMHYWARQLQLSEGDLRRAVDAVGNNAQAVRQFTGRELTPRRGSMRRHGG